VIRLRRFLKALRVALGDIVALLACGGAGAVSGCLATGAAVPGNVRGRVPGGGGAPGRLAAGGPRDSQARPRRPRQVELRGGGPWISGICRVFSDGQEFSPWGEYGPSPAQLKGQRPEVRRDAVSTLAAVSGGSLYLLILRSGVAASRRMRPPAGT